MYNVHEKKMYKMGLCFFLTSFYVKIVPHSLIHILDLDIIFIYILHFDTYF